MGFFAVRATYTNGYTELETIKDTLEDAQKFGQKRLDEEPDEGCGVVEICIDSDEFEPDSNEWWESCHMKHPTRTIKREW